MDKKTIIILRHGKAEAGSAGQEDHDRDLVKRGMEASAIMGEYMAGRRIQLDKVLCSDAIRTRQTWAQLQRTYGQKPPVEYSEKLYLASANETLKLLSATPEEVRSLLIIGHNPGLHQLCVKLAAQGRERTLNELAIKFPTCALAMIDIVSPWRNIAQARGILTDFVTPKMLTGDVHGD